MATWLLCGCATYTRTIREAQLDLTAGRPASALSIINERLDVDEAAELPAQLDENQILLLLERATLLQAIGDYELAARDMMIADQRLDWLDIDGATSVDLGKYLYSGASTPYRAPAYERLLLNTLNMLNFMAMRDFQGARVEARRFRLIEQFVLGEEEDGDPLTAGLLAAGNYLAGVAFEASREYDIAVRHFGRAWFYGHRTDELRGRLVDLARVTGWDGAGVTATTTGPLASKATTAELLAAAKAAGAMRPSPPSPARGSSGRCRPDCTRVELGLKTGFSGDHLRRSLNKGLQYKVIERTTTPDVTVDGNACSDGTTTSRSCASASAASGW